MRVSTAEINGLVVISAAQCTLFYCSSEAHEQGYEVRFVESLSVRTYTCTQGCGASVTCRLFGSMSVNCRLLGAVLGEAC